MQRKDQSGYYVVILWGTVLQGSCSVEFIEAQARYQICEGLMQHENGKMWALNSIGIRKKPNPRDCPNEYSEIMKNENVLINYYLRANYWARRGKNTGFWDIILLNQKPIL